MKITNAPLLRHLIFILVASFSSAVSAATYTWTGASATSNDWSDVANWSTGVPVSDPSTAIVFSSAGAQSSSSPNSFQDLPPNPFVLASLEFSLPGTGNFFLDGGALAANDPNSSTLTITQNSAVAVTIGNKLSASFALVVAGDGTGLLTLNGAVGTASGGVQFTKTGASAVQFNSTSDFYSVDVNAGTVIQNGQQTISRFLNVVAAAYDLIAGSTSANNGISIGENGTLNQSGGSLFTSGSLSIGKNGTYNLMNGMMGTDFDISVLAGGRFNQTGGKGLPFMLYIAGGGSAMISGGTFVGDNVAVGDSSATPAIFEISGTVEAKLAGIELNSNAVVTVSSGATLTVGSSVSSVSGSTFLISNPTSGKNALTVGVDLHGFTLSGSIGDGPTGPGGITIPGQGEAIFDGVNTYTGSTDVSKGLIGGTGRIAGPVTLSDGAIISPGNLITSGPNAGMTDVGHFRVGSLTMNSSTTFQVTLNGAGAGQFDVLTVDNQVTLLTGSKLSLQLNFTPSPGQSFTILNVLSSNLITGQFSNAPDGGIIVTNGESFLVNYEGGDGNDLTVTIVPEPSAVILFAFSLTAMLFARRYISPV
jgi:fibronectin-binding autotransporter adhesin